MEQLNKKIKKIFTVVSHDAGGAEVLSSYIKNKKLNCLYVLKGPAKKIFEKKIGKIKIVSINDALKASTNLICSTSYNSDIEFNALQKSKKNNIFSSVIFDHWHSYKERLTRKTKTILPDEILTVDKYAKEIAQKKFPKTKIKQIKNYHFEEIKKDFMQIITKKSYSNNKNILLLCDPVEEAAIKVYNDKNFFGYNEKTAIKYFLNNINYLNFKYENIIFRLHPSENTNRYKWALKYNNKIKFSNNYSLLRDIANSNLVIGFDTMGLVISLILGKKTISCIPPGGKKMSLPFSEIIDFKSLVINQRFL